MRTLFGIYAIIVFSVVVFVLVCPLVILAPTLRMRRFVGRMGVHVAMWLIASPLRVRNTQFVPDTACIVVSNHASYLDGIVLTAALPAHVNFVVQDGAASWPYVGLVVRRMGVSFVSRSNPRAGSRQMRELIRRSQQGESFAIFPEGTFKAEPGLLAFRDGAFMMAARSGAPVVPCAIRGTRSVLGDGQFLLSPQPIEIEFFEPITIEGEGRDAVRALRERARQTILGKLGEPDSLVAVAPA